MEEEQDHAAEPGQANEVGEGAPHVVMPGQFPFLLPISRFKKYEAKAEEWGVYQERLEQFFCSKWHRVKSPKRGHRLEVDS